MPDQTQSWAERTVEAPPNTQPWAERTVEAPAPPAGFHRGVAQVAPRPSVAVDEFHAPYEPTGPDWSPTVQGPRRPVGERLAELRRGGEWSGAGGLFAFVCWGIWAISARGNLTSPVLAFVLSLFVALGLFALCRLVGRVVLERQLGRVRRTARGAHLVTGLFLVAVGIAYLRQTEWVVNAWHWLTGLG